MKDWPGYFQEQVVYNKMVAALLVAVGLWIVFQLRMVLMLIFVTYILMSGLLPLVDGLQARGLHRLLAVIATVVLVIVVLVALIAPLSLALLKQSGSILETIETTVNQLVQVTPNWVLPENWSEVVTNNLSDVGLGVFAVTGTAFEGFIYVLFILFFSFYLLYDTKSIRWQLLALVPKGHREKVRQREMRIEEKMGAWFRGQLVASFAVGALAFLAYSVIGLPFAVSLAFLAAVLEMIPNLGPTLALTPALIIALTISPLTFLYTFGAFLIIQGMEQYLIIPHLMKRAVGLHPAAVVLAITTGSILLGVAGALLAVPFVSLVSAATGNGEEKAKVTRN